MPAVAGWMDEAVAAAAKDDEATLDRVAGEVADLLAGFPMPGWAPRRPERRASLGAGLAGLPPGRRARRGEGCRAGWR